MQLSVHESSKRPWLVAFHGGVIQAIPSLAKDGPAGHTSETKGASE